MLAFNQACDEAKSKVVAAAVALMAAVAAESAFGEDALRSSAADMDHALDHALERFAQVRASQMVDHLTKAEEAGEELDADDRFDLGEILGGVLDGATVVDLGEVDPDSPLGRAVFRLLGEMGVPVPEPAGAGCDGS